MLNLLRQFGLVLLVFVGLLITLIYVTIATTNPTSTAVITKQPEENQTSQTPELVDVSIASGLADSHIQISGQVDDIRDSFGGSACAADFDRDGWMDLAFIAGQGDTRYFGRDSWWSTHKGVLLYKNEQGTYVSQPFDTDRLRNIAPTGCLAGDLDNDKLPDLLILTDSKDLLFHNLGNFKFEAVESFPKTTMDAWTTHAAATDVNGDGYVDLYLTHFLKYKKNINRFEASSGFPNSMEAISIHQFSTGSVTSSCLTRGGYGFEDVTLASGLGRHSERSVSAIWTDLDKDGLKIF